MARILTSVPKLGRQPQFYKPSGRFRPVDLSSHTLAVFAVVFVLTLLYSVMLMLNSALALTLIYIILPPVWLIATGWLTMLSARAFKIRSLSLAFFMSFLAAVGGYLAAWWVIKFFNVSPVSVFDFMNDYFASTKFLRKYDNKFLFAIGLMFGYALVAAALPLAQAGRPFNEEQNRWFRKYSLPLTCIKAEKYHEIILNIRRGRINDFVTRDDYIVINDILFVGLSFFGRGCLKFTIYYDPEDFKCYLTMHEYHLGFPGVVIISARHLLTSKRLAKAFRRKIMYGHY